MIATNIRVPIARHIRVGLVPYLAQHIPLSALPHQTQDVGGELSETDGAEAAGFDHASATTAKGKHDCA